jgi:hypothetical protein
VSERPLHVQVAEALGARVRFDKDPDGEMDFWLQECDPPERFRKEFVVPRYDTDWSATGPLIEKYGITLFEAWPQGWRAYTACRQDFDGLDYDEVGEGEKHLGAVCHLILALGKAGKL